MVYYNSRNEARSGTSTHVGDGVVDVVAGVLASGGLIVAVVEGGELGEVDLHVLRRHGVEDRLHLGLVARGGDWDEVSMRVPLTSYARITHKPSSLPRPRHDWPRAPACARRSRSRRTDRS